MANAPVTTTWVTNESGMRFINSVKGIPNFNRTYDDQFEKKGGAQVGETILARMPSRFVPTRGQAWQPQAIIDQTVPISLTYQTNVGLDWSSIQQTQDLDRIRDRYINPAADALASDADAQAMQDVYTSVYNAIGTPGTTPSTTLQYLQAVVNILDGAGPTNDVAAVLDVMAAATISNTVSTLFNPSSQISENNKKGRIQDSYLGIKDWYQDQNVPTHTTGSFTASTPIVSGALQTGSTISTTGWASGATTLRKGDVFTIAGVFKTNPLSYRTISRLQQFVVTADTSDAAGAIAALPISPSIITSGQYQTVSNSPAANAAITVWSANPVAGTLAATVSAQSLVFTPDAFAFVMVDLAEPIAGAKSTFVRSRDYNISMRFAQQWLIGQDQNGSRLDILWGAAPLQPRLASRVVG